MDVKALKHPVSLSSGRGLKVTVPFGYAQDRHGVGYRYDDSGTYLCITTSALRGNDEYRFQETIAGHTLKNFDLLIWHWRITSNGIAWIFRLIIHRLTLADSGRLEAGEMIGTISFPT
jgi:hypothetical protein